MRHAVSASSQAQQPKNYSYEHFRFLTAFQYSGYLWIKTFL